LKLSQPELSTKSSKKIFYLNGKMESVSGENGVLINGDGMLNSMRHMAGQCCPFCQEQKGRFKTEATTQP
jgi:hypothetical protein